MFVEPPRPVVGSMASLSGSRRSRGLTDIIPHYSTKSGGGLCGDGEGRTALGGGSVRIHHLTGVSPDGQSRFPKLEECAHFHYDHVDLGALQVSLCEDESLRAADCDADGKMVTVRVSSSGQAWLLRRTYDNFHTLDRQLHRCVYDRKFSNLPDLPAAPAGTQEDVVNQLSAYMKRLSSIAGSQMNCAPVLSWFELDNRGRRLLVTEGDSCPINTPAVAAAYSIKKYNAVAADEISFDIGDMISVIDMPPPEESAWWRGKRGFLVGFFPSHCVTVITEKLPRNLNLNQSLTLAGPTKPVLRDIKRDIDITPSENLKKYFSKRGFNLIPITGMIDLSPNEEGPAISDDINIVKSEPGKHGKLIAFFRAFILSRPSRRRLKQSGILKERVFGCDLGEHLLNSGNEIPMVLKCCSEFIESHGIVDGIYRLSGVTSNIQKIRRTFDEDRVPALYEDEAILQDIHSVASLLKMYFRELPNPLCTYQLYDVFVQAVSSDKGPDNRLLRMREAVQKLPPPHYRTLEYLMRHLVRVSERGAQTGMTARNVAIVWAPNLLRCKELEVGGVAALQGVGVQAVVTEFLIVYADLIFCSAPLPSNTPAPAQVTPKRVRPKSLAISTPTKLLSLEEAQSRALAAGKPDQDYIEVGGGPSCLPAKYHTVIELPRKRAGSKRSPLGWKSFFSKSSRQSNDSRAASGHKSRSSTSEARKTSVPTVVIFGHEKALTESDLTSRAPRRLRPVKSAESLASGQSSARSSSCLEPPSPPTPPNLMPPGHNRSVSHDSYFDTIVDTPRHQPSDGSALLPEEDEEDLSELQVNFDLEESEMRIFSEDETNQLFSSHNSLETQSVKRQPLLARAEDSSADPSPKKHKTGSNGSTNRSKRSRLEERLSNAELRYIDSGSPEQVQTQAEVHGSPPQDSHSPSLAEATVSENESLTLSGLTTPDTPTPRPHYIPLTEDSLSDVVTTPEYRKLTPLASPRYENLPRDRLSYPGDQRPRYENVSRDRLSFQGVLKNGDLGMCETRPNEPYDGEKFCTIDCDLTTEIMDTIMAESKIKDEEAKYEEIKESSIYESVEEDKKMNIYENVTSLGESELYEPMTRKEFGSSYEEISTQDCLVSERLQCGGISSLGSLISPVEPLKENEYECLVVNSSPDESKPTDPNHNVPRALPLAPSAHAANTEENVYEDIQTVSQADSQIYQQVKYLRRSVHEINQLLEESMEPFTGEDVSSLEEEETALVSPMNNESVALSSINVINTSSPLDPTTSFSKRFEEARLRSSGSSDLPTVQTESVTSVSVSPLFETNNPITTNGSSDKDLLYENSTMDDVEAISTSYEEPGRSVEMLYENSKSALEQESRREDRAQSVEMIYENSKSSQELLLNDQSRSVEMLCEDSTTKSTQDSHPGTGKSEDMLFEYSNPKSKGSLEDQGQSVEMFYENSDTNLVQESLVGHENIEYSKNDNTSNSEKDTDKQIDCQFSDLNSVGTSIDSPSRKLTQSLDENKRKFESEIGRGIVRERKMRQELEANSSSTTGQTTSSGRNVQELMSRFEWSRSDKDSLPPCMKARLSRQSSKDNAPTLTTSLDASSFPSDNNPLTRVKTSPDLITGPDRPTTESSQDSEAVRRERIEKYKEERRTFLRNKYRTDSFNNNDDKDEEMIRRLKAKANVRALESVDDNSGVPGGESLNSLEWTARRSPSRKLEGSESNVELSREKELERRLSDHKSDTSSLKRSPSKTLVSISYSPTKTKAPGLDYSLVKCNKPSEINRIPDRIVFNRSVSLNSNPVNLKDTRSSAGSDKTRCRPNDLNLSVISAVKKRDENVSPRVIRMERKPWKESEGEGGCNSPDESLVQRRVNQLSASSVDQADNSVKRRTSLTDLVKPPSSLRARANSGSAKSPSYCIRDMAALFENRDIK